MRLRPTWVGLYNIYNLLGAIAGMHEAGMAIEEMPPRLTKISQIEGRMENIAEDRTFM